MEDEPPKCMYCLECHVQPPTEFSSAKLLQFGCQCKGSMGMFHVYCKAKFARFKTFSTDSPRTREYYWTHCEICDSPFRNNEAVIDLARERHLQCLYHKFDSRGLDDVASLEREESSVPFWVESCNTLSSTIQLINHLTESPQQVALLWSIEMKFVDCLYYIFQMMMDRSTTLEQNDEAYKKVLRLVSAYNIRFGMLALCMFQMKKFAEDLDKKANGKRDKNGNMALTRKETQHFEKLKKKIVHEMKLANDSGGPERHYFSHQLSYQVEFINFEIYGKGHKLESK
ncbi:hypothetical protein HJC23_000204 [Cyclotella cryptica]|uniref:Zinc finger PHD-type domain-containing protein n=1 Tax=Cyclotella cryptica TaxID=29204 RepID=A0ABD3QD38_9STRA